MNDQPLTGTTALYNLEFTLLQISAGIFALASLVSVFFWFFKKESIGKAAWVISIIAALSLTATIVIRWVNVGHIPYIRLYETFMFCTWAMIVIALIVDQIVKSRLASTVAVIIGTLVLVYIYQWPATTKQGYPLMPALQSPWLDVHIATAFLAYAGFAISAGCSIVYMFNRNDAIDNLSYRLVAFAFPMLGLGIILGAVWAREAWGTYWAWDPKETAALVTWLVYAGYLHARLVLGWKGVKAGILNLIGFFCVLFTWVGLTILSKYINIASQHVYT